MGFPLVPLPEELVSIVRQKTRRMIGRAGLKFGDLEEVEQILTMRAWLSLESYDPGKSPLEAYLRAVVNHGASNFLRDRRAARRNPGPIVPLHLPEAIDDAEVAELAQQVSRRELDARSGAASEDEHEASQRRLDINEFIAVLPYADRELVRALKWKTVSEISRATGVPRTTINSRIRRLRTRFENAGLRDYLR